SARSSWRPTSWPSPAARARWWAPTSACAAASWSTASAAASVNERDPGVPLPEITLPELFAEWDVAGRRVPVEGVLEPTFRCNLRCVHCYVNQDAASPAERARELPTERLVARRGEDAGARWRDPVV